MDNSKKTLDHSHEHTKDCACDHSHDHNHEHGHEHDHQFLTRGRRWFLSVLMVGALLVLLKPFILGQMLVRVTSYEGSFSYHNVIRICHKIIALDRDNIEAWTALGYAYMDTSRLDKAIAAFEKVLALNPRDRGAASYELGKAYYAKKDYQKAIDSFERIRQGGPHVQAVLEADILKYRHGREGFRSLTSMQTMLGDLADAYRHMGNSAQAAEVQKEYVYYKNKHSAVLF
ncbi:MAG: tetratricopeptide repeat protein [Candidatus Omnitrophica bacterium]|nr:tetratricopeptide repeat protein [Candidatus Omnitrophota bacterium]MDE2008919.1 tetratricopeptide repeat protein [Candidatus Omnitrophota bacterium]MDE2213518.1 tetratricopeptide repeat protein [Candidatus Omnitrophota bacterium]MDE2230581.1 tetratricopeptide repeat protein [Candidatus Omnitrophota bacterium]